MIRYISARALLTGQRTGRNDSTSVGFGSDIGYRRFSTRFAIANMLTAPTGATINPVDKDEHRRPTAIPNMTELEGCKPPPEPEKRPQPLDLSR
jgi:hypothetical protein